MTWISAKYSQENHISRENNVHRRRLFIASTKWIVTIRECKHTKNGCLCISQHIKCKSCKVFIAIKVSLDSTVSIKHFFISSLETCYLSGTGKLVTIQALRINNIALRLCIINEILCLASE